ncbi:unnamed protein product [Brassica oleracea]
MNKKIMSILAKRDAAVLERDQASSAKKEALARPDPREGNVVRGMMVKPTNLLPFPLSTANKKKKKKKKKVTKRKKENKPKGKKLGDEDLNPSPGKKLLSAHQCYKWGKWRLAIVLLHSHLVVTPITAGAKQEAL